jgi:hypothetical protein
MTKAKMVTYADLAATFRYEDSGKLFRLLKSGQWREVDMSKSNHKEGYVAVKFNGTKLLAHRIIYSLFHKIDLPTDLQIDHTNGNRIDNHICNLELGTHRDNGQNLKCHRAGKLCGACWHKRRNKWQAQIQINGKHKYLGLFETEIEAHLAYNTAAAYITCGIDFTTDDYLMGNGVAKAD